MLDRIMTFLKLTVAPLLVLAALGIGFWWNEYGQEWIQYKDVVVLTEPILENEIIEKEDVAVIRVDQNRKVPEAFTTIESVVGKKARLDLAVNQQLYQGLIEEPALLLKEGQHYMPMPSAWLEDTPDTLRRGDQVILYAMKDKEKDALGFQDTVKKLYQTTLTHAMDSTNTEVESLNHFRTKGTSTATEYEIILTEKQIEAVMKLATEGYKFKFVYIN